MHTNNKRLLFLIYTNLCIEYIKFLPVPCLAEK